MHRSILFSSHAVRPSLFGLFLESSPRWLIAVIRENYVARLTDIVQQYKREMGAQQAQKEQLTAMQRDQAEQCGCGHEHAGFWELMDRGKSNGACQHRLFSPVFSGPHHRYIRQPTHAKG
jgi:hypothetical protein